MAVNLFLLMCLCAVIISKLRPPTVVWRAATIGHNEYLLFYQKEDMNLATCTFFGKEQLIPSCRLKVSPNASTTSARTWAVYRVRLSFICNCTWVEYLRRRTGPLDALPWETGSCVQSNTSSEVLSFIPGCLLPCFWQPAVLQHH